MILVTTGTQLPSGRLVRVVHEWLGRPGRIDAMTQFRQREHVAGSIRYRQHFTPTEFVQEMAEGEYTVFDSAARIFPSAKDASRSDAMILQQPALGECGNDHELVATGQVAACNGASSYANGRLLADVCGFIGERH